MRSACCSKSPHGGARGNNGRRLFEDALFKRQPPVKADEGKGGTTSAVNLALELLFC